MYEVEGCICGFYVYYAVWMPQIGEQLDCALDRGNSEAPFTVAVKKNGETIGHVLWTILCVFSRFLQRPGLISCTVTVKRSDNLPQGGLKVPCILRFTGPEELREGEEVFGEDYTQGVALKRYNKCRRKQDQAKGIVYSW